jgi:hypothetical protein
MNSILQNQTWHHDPARGLLNGIVLAVLLALTFVLTVGNVWADEPAKPADSSQQVASKAQAADTATAAHTADTAKKKG